MTDIEFVPDWPAVEPIGSKPSKLQAIPFSEIEVRSVEWLEPPLWQSSCFQLLSGPKGAGKGTYLASLISRVSNAGGTVIVCATEDSAELDLKPRLVAAGYAEARCHLIRTGVRLPDDIEEIRLLAGEYEDVRLIVIDPLSAHIGRTDSNDETAVRDAIGGLNGLADSLRCLIVGVRHPGKDRTRGALTSILGSTAWVDVPRAVVMIARDDEDEDIRHIQCVAGNRARTGSAWKFRIEGVAVEGVEGEITRVVDYGPSDKHVDDLLASTAKPTSQRGVVDEMRNVVLEHLGTGQKSRAYINELCSDEFNVGADHVYKNALTPLREEGLIRAVKAGFEGGWDWCLA